MYLRAHDRKSFFPQGDLLSSKVSGTNSAPDMNDTSADSAEARGLLIISFRLRVHHDST